MEINIDIVTVRLVILDFKQNRGGGGYDSAISDYLLVQEVHQYIQYCVVDVVPALVRILS